MMGSGKTTVGKLVAKKLKWKFYDSDRAIEQKTKMSIPQIFKKKGEKWFRKKEKEVIKILTQNDEMVIATGGGVPCFKENWNAFRKNSLVIWLNAKPKLLFQRIVQQKQNVRPLLQEQKSMLRKIEELLSERKIFYKKAHKTVQTNSLTTQQAANKIVSIAKLFKV